MLEIYIYYARTMGFWNINHGLLGYSPCSFPGNIDKASVKNKDKQSKTKTKQTKNIGLMR